MGSNSLPYGSRNFFANLENNLQGGSGSPASNDSSNHEDSSDYNFDPTNGGQSEIRVYTLKEDLSQEELSVFEDKIKELKSKGIAVNEKIPFEADAFKALDKGITIGATNSAGSKGIQIDSSFQIERANGKHVYPCANLIEFLLSINTKIKLTGGFDLGRDAMIEGSGAIADGKRLNDHSSGRGIDCFHIGSIDSSLINLKPKNLENNKKAFTILLDAMMHLDESLLPDLVVFDDRLADEFGIVQGGNEFTSSKAAGVNGIIQKKYKNLKKVNFSANTGHQNHIHIAFSPERAGTYLDYTIADPGSEWDSTTPEGTAGSSEQLIFEPELYQSAINQPDKVIKNKNALYRALVEFGKFKPQQAALFMAITERESHFQSGGFNGKITTGDYSFGFWQVNFYGEGVSDRLDMFVNVPSINNGKITSKKVKLLHLVFKDHASLGITTKEQATALMETIFKTEGIGGGRKYADPILFWPAVQVQLLKLITDSSGNPNWKFSPWGEYGGGPAYGWITKLKFKTAVDFYVKNNPGKTEEDLKSFCRPFVDNMKKFSPEGIAVYSQWLDGVVFGG